MNDTSNKIIENIEDPLYLDNFETEISIINKNTPNKNYNVIYAWSYAIIHAFGGFYFGYATTCMNNLAIAVISIG